MTRTPGWDAAAISRIATEHYGGLLEMFEHFEWPERGAAMMPAQGRRVCEQFGSIEQFVRFHDNSDAQR
ncbi:MAG: hypothetical protein Q8Q63_14200 [Phaeovulum sp.]|uniref:hypothetical protein n=1 Tax=Phaeovulum sp. TaxID=2934796 RepID=UPI0027372CFE|nr:hypothetical protein [Phaeovulum sp.]MDP3862724.1 hypothetical protein [Phaeovulum sp.]